MIKKYAYEKSDHQNIRVTLSHGKTPEEALCLECNVVLAQVEQCLRNLSERMSFCKLLDRISI